MKKQQLLLILFITFFSFTANAQSDSWRICINKKIVLNGNSNKPESSLIITTSCLKKTDKIEVDYIASSVDDKWKRSIFISNLSNDKIVTADLSTPTGSVSFQANKLESLMKQKEPAFIYTIAIPKDKSLAAAIRVRSVLLCKIVWR